MNIHTKQCIVLLHPTNSQTHLPQTVQYTPQYISVSKRGHSMKTFSNNSSNHYNLKYVLAFLVFAIATILGSAVPAPSSHLRAPTENRQQRRLVIDNNGSNINININSNSAVVVRHLENDDNDNNDNDNDSTKNFNYEHSNGESTITLQNGKIIEVSDDPNDWQWWVWAIVGVVGSMLLCCICKCMCR